MMSQSRAKNPARAKNRREVRVWMTTMMILQRGRVRAKGRIKARAKTTITMMSLQRATARKGRKGRLRKNPSRVRRGKVRGRGSEKRLTIIVTLRGKERKGRASETMAGILGTTITVVAKVARGKARRERETTTMIDTLIPDAIR